MRKIYRAALISSLISASIGLYAQQSVAIGTSTPDPAAVLLLVGNGNQGLIIPVTSNAQGIVKKAGMVVFNTADNKVYYCDGTNWAPISGGVNGTDSQTLTINGNTLSISNGNSQTISGTPPTTVGQVLAWDGGKWTATAATVPSNNQVLMWNGTTWAPATLASGGTVTNVTAGAGLTGGPITTTGTLSVNVGIAAGQIPQLDAGGKLNTSVIPGTFDANAADDITTATAAAGDLAGTYPNPTIGTSKVTSAHILDGSIAAADLNSMGAVNSGQVLQWNGTAWAPATLASASFGNLTTTTSGITITGGTGAVAGSGATVNVQNATASQPGLLTAGNFTTFNNKVSSVTGSSTITVGGTATAPTVSLSNTAVTAGSYGSASQVPQLTIDAQGRITAVTLATIPVGGDMLKTTYDTNTDNIVDAAATAAALSTTLPLTSGGTGATTAVTARTNLGLGTLATASAVTSTEITDGTIVGGDLATNIAITTTGGITAATFTGNGSALTGVTVADGSVTGGTAGAGVKIAAGTITDANINTSANIADTKLATITTAGKVSGNAINTGTIGGNTIINTTGGITAATFTGNGSALTGVTVADGSVTGGTAGAGVKIAAGTITDANINTTANIAATKLAGTVVLDTESPTANDIAGTFAAGLTINANTITNAEIVDASVTGTDIALSTITNANIGATAAIDVTKLAAGTNGQVLTTTAGVPAWGASFVNPMTTPGDIIYRDGTGPQRLGTGTGFLKGGATPSYSAVNLATTDVSGTLLVANGGTGASTLTGILIGNGTGAVTTQTAASGNQYLRRNSGNTAYEFGDLTLTSGDIVDGTIVNIDINAAAAIDGTKINPSFGSQNIATSGTLTATTGLIAGTTNFTVDGAGNITKINNVVTSFPTSQGTAGTVLTNDGAGILTWGALPSSFTTANVIPKGNGTTLIASTIFDDGTLVGIGTATPVATLDVNGGSTGIRVQGYGVNGNGLSMVNTDVSTSQWSTLALGTSGLLGPSKGFSISDVTNNTNPLVIEPSTPSNTLYLDNTGGIGIGTATPGAKLEIAGQIKITGGTPGAGKVLTSDASGLATWASGSGWGLTGNTGTVDGTNFIGTTDNIPLNFRVNNQKAGRIDDALSNTFYGILAGSQNTTGPGYGNTAIGKNSLKLNSNGWENTAIGHFALENSDGVNNTAVGAGSQATTSSGGENTSVGVSSLQLNTTGIGNTAVGRDALVSNTTGSSNTAIGQLADVTVGNLFNATAIGYNAKVGASNSLILGGTGADAVNVGIGTTTPISKLDVGGDVRLAQGSAPGTPADKLYNVGGSLFWNGTNISGGSGWALGGNSGLTDGAIGVGNNYIGSTTNVPLNFIVNNQKAGRIDATLNNTFFGTAAGNANYTAGTGYANVAYGWNALSANVNGYENTAIGHNALANSTVPNNTAVGSYTLVTNTIGADNTGLGGSALEQNTSGNNNVAIGHVALVSNTTGSFNTAVGWRAGVTGTIGNANVTGSKNTFIGFQAGPATSTQLTNATAIGSNALVNASNSLILGGTGADAVNVGIGTTTPISKLDVGGDVRLAQGSAPGTVTDKLYNVAGSLFWNGTNISSGGGSFTGANFVPRGNGTSQEQSTLFNSNTFTGINTATQEFASSFIVNSQVGGNAYGGMHVKTTTGGKPFYGFIDNGAEVGWIDVNTGTGNTMEFWNGGGLHMAINGTGNVGIGTTTPSSILEISQLSPQVTLRTTGAGVSEEAYYRIVNNIGTSLGWMGDPGSGTYLEIGSPNQIRFNSNFADRFAIGTSGELFANNASTPGTPGQVLTSAGGGSPAVWANAGSGWGLTGNAGTVDGTNFIGTTDFIALNFRVGGMPSGKIDPVGIQANTFLGYSSGSSNTGTLSTGFGFQTLQSNSGSNNTAMGSYAMITNTSGFANTAVGGGAMRFNTTGSANTAHGVNTLYKNTTGNNNTALGNGAMFENTAGFENTAVGTQAMQLNTIGGGNTATGFYALIQNTASNNVAMGTRALESNTTGTSNTAVGYYAGYTNTFSNANTTGSNNTFIGYSSGPGTPTQLTNATAIGANALVNANNSLVLGGTGGNAVNVGIGTTAPTAKLDVVGGNINTDGEVNRTASGASNMVPIAYGFVNASGGMLSGTSNISASNGSAGTYSITVSGETINSTNYVAIVTPSNGGGAPVTVSVQANSPNLNVYLRDVTGGGSGNLTNFPFYIVIYKY